MDNIIIVAQQLLIMFIYIFIGWTLARSKLITDEGSKSLSNLLLYIVLPCAIINSFDIQATGENIRNLLISFSLGGLALGIAVLLSLLMFKNKPVHNFSAAFSNAGFMGIPLISSVFGNHAVFYIAGMVAILNVLQWTYGQRIFSKEKTGGKWYYVLKSPLVIGFFIALIRFFMPFDLPVIISKPISAIASCNAPLAMIILGVFLNNTSIAKGLKDPSNWIAVSARLIIIPIVTVLIFCFMKEVSYEIKMSIAIACAAPVGSNVVLYAQRQNADSKTATILVCISTVLSLLTMPVIVMFADFLWT